MSWYEGWHGLRPGTAASERGEVCGEGVWKGKVCGDGAWGFKGVWEVSLQPG